MLEDTTIGGLGLAGAITNLCATYDVPHYYNDTRVAPQRKITHAIVLCLKASYMYGAPPEAPSQRGRCQPQPNDNVGQLVVLAGPLDPAMKYTHDQLNYIIQQNNHMENYMVKRNAYVEKQVRQLNTLI
uniref:Uncharacterized protein n=1 Tax=Cannabis sativa TaxID=3483 RepID=A0A803Q4P2_CANSA